MSARKLTDITADLEVANAELERAQRALAIALNEECAAVNLVNKLQREIGSCIEAMRKAAPCGSDWRASPRRRLAPTQDAT